MLTLETSITAIPRYGKLFAKRLLKLKITTVRDLLLYFPFRYEDLSRVAPIAHLKGGEIVTVRGIVIAIQNRRSFRRRLFLTEALVRDESGTLRVIWFNQAFLTRVLPLHSEVWLSGKVVHDTYGLHLQNPVYEKVEKEALHTGRIVPIYSLTPPLTQKQLRVLISLALPAAELLRDELPQELVKERRLLPLHNAVKELHFPETMDALRAARRRMAFAELFSLHTRILATRNMRKAQHAPTVSFFEKATKAFVQSLPFQLTQDQRKAAWEILADLAKPLPARRLLNGDVGSGKTVVAAIAALNVVLSGHRVLFMVPTEILAEQHAQTFAELFTHTTVRIALLTASHKITKKDAASADLLIGTHALLHPVRSKAPRGACSTAVGRAASNGVHAKDVSDDVGLVIVDEQHRFGVQQRTDLVDRGTDAEQTRNNAESIAHDDTLLYGDLTYRIRSAIFNVKKTLGSGHKEVVYQRALIEEFHHAGLKVDREKRIPISYRGKEVGIYQPDFVIENKVIVELKAIPFIGAQEKKQLWHYLKGSVYRLGLLVNFGPQELTIERIVYDRARSASHPHRSAFIPHMLSMTATPIPRTLAQTIFGDFDISFLHTLPKGRKTIVTRMVTNDLRSRAYDFIRKEIRAGHQVFVICPLIDPSDTLGVRAATDVYAHLRKEIFPDCSIGILHGRVKPKEREQTMRAFVENKINVLVATSMVEVGIDIRNASVMMIEGAERFGLAQLHQLRGRVGRSDAQSYCFLFTDGEDPVALKRLAAVVRSSDGFALAEADLRLRGPGEMFGVVQSGYFAMRFARWNDLALIKETKEAAARFGAHIHIDPVRSLVG